MSVTAIIVPRSDAASVELKTARYDGDGWHITAYGWEIKLHPLWRLDSVRWTQRHVNYNHGVVDIDETVEQSDFNLDVDPEKIGLADSKFWDGEYNSKEDPSVSPSIDNRGYWTLGDMTFTFVHSQSGRIIRTPLGTIMRSAGGVVLRDN